MNILQKISQKISNCPFFTKAKKLWEDNQNNFFLPLNKFQKLYVGIYVILKDYSEGIFPPTFEDQQLAYDNEMNYFYNLPGIKPSLILDSEIRKPFWFSNEKYIKYFVKISEIMNKCGIKPPQKIIELGAGSGWMCEFFSAMKFQAIATTIAPDNIKQINKRIASLKEKDIDVTLQVFQTPMETIDEFFKENNPQILPVDAVFVFEALHHAYDWEKSIESAFKSLKSGGWLLICNEPNLLHTFISYRVAKLSNTHEIGLSRSSLIKKMKEIGFQKIVTYSNKIDFMVKTHWIVAQK